MNIINCCFLSMMGRETANLKISLSGGGNITIPSHLRDIWARPLHWALEGRQSVGLANEDNNNSHHCSNDICFLLSFPTRSQGFVYAFTYGVDINPIFQTTESMLQRGSESQGHIGPRQVLLASASALFPLPAPFPSCLSTPKKAGQHSSAVCGLSGIQLSARSVKFLLAFDFRISGFMGY